MKVVDSCGWLEVAQHLLEVAGDAAELWTHDEHFRGLRGPIRFIDGETPSDR